MIVKAFHEWNKDIALCLAIDVGKRIIISALLFVPVGLSIIALIKGIEIVTKSLAKALKRLYNLLRNFAK